MTARLLFKGRHAIVTPDAPGLNVARAIRDEAERDAPERDRRTRPAPPEGDRPDPALGCRGADREARSPHEIAALLAAAEAVLEDGGRDPELLLDGAGPARAGLAGLGRRGGARGGRFRRAWHCRGAGCAGRPGTVCPVAAGCMCEPTRALVAVDVDTGDDGSPAAALKANIAALRALPRHLRLSRPRRADRRGPGPDAEEAAPPAGSGAAHRAS